MKKIKMLLCGLLLSISLMGCSGVNGEYLEPTSKSTMIGEQEFLIIEGHSEEIGDYYIYVDKETRVQYLCSIGSYNSGFVVLIDADGKPILYEGTID